MKGEKNSRENISAKCDLQFGNLSYLNYTFELLRVLGGNLAHGIFLLLRYE